MLRSIYFEGVDYPEYTAARNASDVAYQAWHNAVGGNADLHIPRNETLAALHDSIKLRTNNPALPEPRTPFWNAQATTLGFFPEYPSDNALVEELKRGYATHVGPETEALARANLALHEHQIPLLRSQLDVLRKATTLQGMPDEEFLGIDGAGAMQPHLVAGMEGQLASTEAAKAHLETYLSEMPALRGERPPPPVPRPLPVEAPHVTSYVQTFEQQASHQHSWNKWAIAGAVGVAALSAGAYILRQKNPKKEEKSHSGEPMKIDTVQMGAQQRPGTIRRLQTSNLHLEPDGSVSIRQ